MRISASFRAGFLLAFLGLGPVAVHGEDGTEFLMNTSEVGPTTTFEVRFSEPQIKAEAIGKPADPAPAKFSPDLQGEWIWVSSRSASFSPSEPLSLATQYTLTGKGGEWSFETPGFGVVAVSPKPSAESEAARSGSIQVLFNADIDAAQVDGKAYYESDQGEHLAAAVRPATGRDYFPTYAAPGRTDLTWNEQFYAARGRMLDPLGVNRLVFSPSEPLTVGRSWTLKLPAGISSASGDFKLEEAWSLPVGKVTDMAVKSITATNQLGVGPRIVVDLTKPLPYNLPRPELQGFFEVKPAVENLTATANYSAVQLTGDFKPEQEYSITVQAGLPTADDDLALPKAFSRSVVMPSLDPRLMLPTLAQPQLLTGKRDLEVRAVNVGDVKVAVKKLSASELPKALTLFADARSKRDWGTMDEGRVAWEEVPGEASEESVDLSAPRNEIRTTPLSLDKWLGKGAPGSAFVQVTSEGTEPIVGAQTLVMVTDLGLVWKIGATRVLLYAHSLTTGEPLEGVKIEFLDSDFQVLETATTDSQGLAEVGHNPKMDWLVGELGSDVNALELGGETVLPRTDFDVPYSWSVGQGAPQSIMLFTDRGVYLPGDEVHIRGIARLWKEGRMAIPEGEEMSMTVRDARGRPLLEKTIKLDDWGSFEQTVATPIAPTGTYSVDCKLEGRDSSGNAYATFQVEEYEPAAITLSTDFPENPLAVDATPVELTARYQTGEPVEGGQASWSINVRADVPSFTRDLDGFDFGIGPYLLREYLDKDLPDATLTGKATLDEAGQARFEVPGMPAEGIPYEARVNMDVVELGGQTISEEIAFELAAADFYLGLKRTPPITLGETLKLQVVAATRDGKPLNDIKEGKLTVYQIKHQTIREKAAGGAWRFRSQTETKKLSEADFKTVPLVEENGFIRLEDPEAASAAPVEFAEEGQYLIILEAKDASGRPTIAGDLVNVFGPEFTTWHQKDPNVIELIPDRAEYRPGDTAKVYVKSSISGRALVTVERDSVMNQFVVPLAEGSPAVEIPLEVAESPNAFVSVLVFRGAADSPHQVRMPEYRAGYCELVVGDPTRELQVAVQPSADEFEPREKVSATIHVRDHAGKPVEGANVTFYAIDEGVLELTDYKTPDPADTFFEKQLLGVQTGLSLRILKDEDIGSGVFANKGYIVGGKGLEMGLLQARSEFPPLAYWNAGLTTGADGSVTADFEAPDTLTRYRVIAIVQSGAEQFGSGESEFRVKQPLMLKPSWPRITRVGDRIDARVLMQNGTDQDGSVKLALLTEGPARIASDAKGETDTTLPAGKSKAVSIPVEITGTGEILWNWTGTMDAAGGTPLSDAVENTTLSRRVTPLRREIQNPLFKSGEEYPLEKFDPQLLESEEVSVEVAFSKSRLIEIREAVESLLNYPYGCLEQTTSSLLPWYTMNDLGRVIPGLKADPEKINETIVRGIERILSFQVSGGGLSYWPGEGNAALWPSAYAAIALAEGVDGGYLPGDDQRLDKLAGFLSQSLRGTGEDKLTQSELAARTMAAYALARLGRPEPAYHEALYAKRGAMGAETRLFLALALAESGGAPEQIATLQKEAREWDSKVWFGSRDRLEALQLLTDVRRGATDEEMNEAFTRLLRERRNGQWLNTQANAWAMLASVAFDETLQGEVEQVTAHIDIDGVEEEITLTNEEPTVRRAFDGSRVDPKAVAVTPGGEGMVFGDVQVAAYVPGSSERLDQHGLTVVRTYEKILPGGERVPAENLEVGDKVLVTLQVTASRPGTYAALSDPLPALFEAINPNFATQQTGDNVGSWTAFNSHRELREDRALFFADRLPSGPQTVRYLARVRQAGEATAPPTRVEFMYDPIVYGLGISEKVSADF